MLPVIFYQAFVKMYTYSFVLDQYLKTIKCLDKTCLRASAGTYNTTRYVIMYYDVYLFVFICHVKHT